MAVGGEGVGELITNGDDGDVIIGDGEGDTHGENERDVIAGSDLGLGEKIAIEKEIVEGGAGGCAGGKVGGFRDVVGGDEFGGEGLVARFNDLVEGAAGTEAKAGIDDFAAIAVNVDGAAR